MTLSCQGHCRGNNERNGNEGRTSPYKIKQKTLSADSQ